MRPVQKSIGMKGAGKLYQLDARRSEIIRLGQEWRVTLDDRVPADYSDRLHAVDSVFADSSHLATASRDDLVAGLMGLHAFVRKQKREYLNGHFPTTTLDGWWQMELPAPRHVEEAVVRALPLPKTIREARDEYHAWQLRERELQVLRGSRPDTWLSLGCQLRKQFVDMMLSFELEAANIEDVMIRLEVLAERDSWPGMELVLNDLANLSAKEEAGECAVHVGRLQTATERRTEVQRLLSNVDTAGLSDREIARRVGVSPQTVGNIRRRMVNP